MVKEVEMKEEIQEEKWKIPKTEPEGDYELICLGSSHPDHTVKIGLVWTIDVHMKILEVLIEFKDNFAEKPTDLGIVPKKIL